MALFLVIRTHSSRHDDASDSLQSLRWGWPWSHSIDQPQNLLEQFLRHRDLGHLEDDVAAMAHDLGVDLDELLPQARQRPLLDCLRQSQRPHEVGEIVGQRMQLKLCRCDVAYWHFMTYCDALERSKIL